MNMVAKNELAESLLKCRVEGNTVFLPPISDGPLHNYADVRKALLNAGAKYKRNSFIFSSDAQPFMDRLTGGESVNIKKEFQFFPTPPDIAEWLVDLADIRSGMKILEPSAGQGAILKQIDISWVDVCEIMVENQTMLELVPNSHFICADFLKLPDEYKEYYDRIVANPPFNKNQDIDHIMKMWECLKPGGRIVSVASKHWQLSGNKKEKAFRQWLEDIGAEIYDIERGRFKESGTMISCCVVVIDKPL